MVSAPASQWGRHMGGVEQTPDAAPVRRKDVRRRWQSKKRIYEWDYQRGAVEVYDKQGKHLGEVDPNTGERTGDAKPERTTTR